MIGFLDAAETAKSFRQCQEYTKHYAKTFYFASHVLPKEKRDAAYALYAFCRYADEIGDNAEMIGDRVRASKRLAGLRDQLRYVYAHSDLMNSKLLAFRSTVLKYGIPQEYFVDLLRGVEMDFTKDRYATFDELEEYCYCVASTVGLIMTRVFGASSDQALVRAVELGKAMQLTNILRDVGEDYRRGRIYLPLDELARFGVTEMDIKKGIVTENYVNLLEFQIQRARWYYERAQIGIPMLTNDGSRFCVSLMSKTYGRILSAIETNGYDTMNHRAFVPLTGKIAIALATALSRAPKLPAQQDDVPLSPSIQTLPIR
jgi:phytoene synthase